MSRLRPHLESARNAYSSVSYPGDLSTEVMGKPWLGRGRIWLVRVGFGGLGLAASVAWVVLLSRPKPPTPRPRLNDNQRESVAAVPKEMSGLSLSPPAMPEMPEMPDLSAMPVMPPMPAGFSGMVAPTNAPSMIPEMIPLEPPGFPPTMAPTVSHGTGNKEPA